MFHWVSLLLASVPLAIAIPTGGYYVGQVNSGPGTLCLLDNGISVVFENDGNLVVYKANKNVLWASYAPAPGRNCNGLCRLNFQTDGNLVTYYNGQPLFNTVTGGGKGSYLICTQESPYLMVLDVHGTRVWATPAG